MQHPEVKDQLLANTPRSVERGALGGSPTFFVDDEIFFGKDRLRDVEDFRLIPLHPGLQNVVTNGVDL